MIYHITRRNEWEQAQTRGDYITTSLNTQGFIHASTRDQVVKVGNALYRTLPDCVLLCVDETLLDVPLKWETADHPDPSRPPAVADSELFPHIYGPIPLPAVVKVVDFPLGADGVYEFPEEAD